MAGAAAGSSVNKYVPEPETEHDIQREIHGLLGRRAPEHRHMRTLAIDLDETLVHSSFKPVPYFLFVCMFYMCS